MRSLRFEIVWRAPPQAEEYCGESEAAKMQAGIFSSITSSQANAGVIGSSKMLSRVVSDVERESVLTERERMACLR